MLKWWGSVNKYWHLKKLHYVTILEYEFVYHISNVYFPITKYHIIS